MLLIGYGLNKKSLDEEIAFEAIRDLRWSPYFTIQDSFDISEEDKEKLFHERDNLSTQSINSQNRDDKKIRLIKKAKTLNLKKSEITESEELQKQEISRKATELLEDLEVYEEEKEKNKHKRSIFDRIRSSISSK
jgi:hypothetical protein